MLSEELSFLYEWAYSVEFSCREIQSGFTKSIALAAVLTDYSSDLENLGEGHACLQLLFVPISASGLQGKEPLVDGIM